MRQSKWHDVFAMYPMAQEVIFYKYVRDDCYRTNSTQLSWLALAQSGRDGRSSPGLRDEEPQIVGILIGRGVAPPRRTKGKLPDRTAFARARLVWLAHGAVSP